MNVKLNGNDFYRVTSEFGAIDSAHPNPHTGIDLAIPEGTELLSPASGFVEKIVDYGDTNIGKGLFIKTEKGETLILGHLSDIKVDVGDKIKVGDFIAVSGNSGNSTGAHLHLGLKNEQGQFINPDKFLNEKVVDDKVSFTESISTFTKFIQDVRDESLFYAIYGDTFPNVAKNFLYETGRSLLKFILSNGDLFFLIPSVAFLFLTFFIGKNKFTKFIIPLFFAYFVVSILNKLIFLGGE